MIDMHPELREQLGAMACPCCYQRGMLTIELRLVSRPIGTWSLAGSQLKTSAMEVPYLVCTVPDCGFVKAPEHVISD